MKKILALCLTVMLLVAMVPVIGASAADAALFSVDAVEGARGDEVTVTVSIAENPGLCTAQIMVGYDATALEVVKITPLMFAGAATSNGPTTANPLKVTWSNPLADTTETGAIATITFKIKEDAEYGTYALAVTSSQANVFDTLFNDVPFTTADGSIKVVCKHTATETVGAKDASCSAEGYTGDTVCSDCGETLETGKAIDKLAHTEVVEDAKAATCTEAGSTGTTKCSVCGDVLKEAEVIEALGHTEVVEGAKAATCEDEGYTGDTVCSVCDEVLEKGEVIAALGHTIVEVPAVDATCTDDGNVAHYACETCGATYADAEGTEPKDDVIIKATGHNYVDGKCTVCGDEEVKEEEKPAETPEDKPAETPNTDDGTKAPATGDVANIFVVVAMLMAVAAAAVVVLKKKA